LTGKEKKKGAAEEKKRPRGGGEVEIRHTPSEGEGGRLPRGDTISDGRKSLKGGTGERLLVKETQHQAGKMIGEKDRNNQGQHIGMG